MPTIHSVRAVATNPAGQNLVIVRVSTSEDGLTGVGCATSPVGHAANLHLDLASFAFGIQELAPFTDAEREVFDGMPTLRGGYLYPGDRPGLGIELDEGAAARFPATPEVPAWTQARLPDGSLARP